MRLKFLLQLKDLQFGVRAPLRSPRKSGQGKHPARGVMCVAWAGRGGGDEKDTTVHW